MNQRWPNFLIFLLIFSVSNITQTGNSYSAILKVHPQDNHAELSFDRCLAENSSKYFLLSNPIINPAIAVAIRSPFYTVFIEAGNPVNQIPGRNAVVVLNLMADYVQSAALSLILFPFHTFP